jgi:signal transduction histidine kinase/CheY-like chemotaxis protein
MTVLESIDADVYAADLKTYEILFANKHMRGSFGDGLVGKKCYQVFRADSEPCEFCTNPKLLDTDGKPSGVQIWEGRNPVSQRWYVNCDRAIRWTDGRFVRLQVATDITRLKEAEERKTQLEAQLLQAQRLESIGTLAGGIAHNFNNLLMAIQGNAALMLMEADSAHPYRERLESIEESVRTGSRLTGQLLGYAQQGRYEVRPVDPNDLVRHTSDTFAMARKEIRIHRKLVGNPGAIQADQGQIEQLLMNLYVNAADAMPQGGDLYLSTENVTHQDMTGKAYQPKSGSYLLLTVRDTGLGMDRETQERIFEPFFTTKGLERGTGLGLASVYGIVKGHGGYIDVDSSKGSGTTFSIYLPTSGKALQMEQRSATGPVKGKGSILLVDDEDMILEVGKRMLNNLGYEVLTAGSGEESLDLYSKSQESIDLVILDMIIPDMGGGAIYDRLKEMNSGVKVLLSSGYSIEGKASEILARGCDGFIQKPFSIQSLSQKVKQIIAEDGI